MRKRLKFRALTFVAAVILIVSCIVIPCSAASSFPDNYANLLDCDEFFTRLSSKINAALYDFAYDASVGTCMLTSKNENNFHLGSAFIGTIQDICPGIKAGVWYTFHCEEADSKRNFSICWENYTRELKNGDVFMLDAAELTQRIFISVYNVIPADKLYTYAHLAIVPSSMPLSGSFTDQTYPSFFSYQQELDAAKQEILQNIESRTVNVFAVSTLDVWVNVLGHDFTPEDLDDPNGLLISNIEYTVSDDGKLLLHPIFSRAIEQARALYPSVDYTYAYFDLTFRWPLPSDNLGAWNYHNGPISISSAGAALSDKQIDVAGLIYDGYHQGQYVWSTGSTKLVNGSIQILANKFSADQDISVNSFNLGFGTGDVDLLSVSSGWYLTSEAKVTSPLYTFGYAQGYIDGENAEFGDMKDEAYESGWNAGYHSGKKEGLSISETGDWRTLFVSVVEAPVNTFQSLFNFEILGLDMRLAFGSMLAVCVFLIIVKKVIL